MPAAPTPKPTPSRTLLRLFTPLNVLIILLALAAGTTAAIMQMTPHEISAPRRRMEISAPPAENAANTIPASVASVIEGNTKGSELPLFKEEPPVIGLDPAPPGVRVPVNAMDLFSGKPNGFGAPTKTYKGYTVGFCCANSAGMNGGWESLNEAEKDTFVRHFLPK